MKVETKKAQSSEFRQDLLRGIRWGTILLIAMLLGIAAYRVLSSSPATASEPKPTEEITPVPEAAPNAAPAAAATNGVANGPAIQVGGAAPKPAVLAGPDAPPAPPKTPAKTARTAVKFAKPEPQPVESPEHILAPHFAPLPTPVAKSNANAFVAEPLPAVTEAPAPAVELPSPRNPALAPPPSDDPKQGSRAGRAVRSVGRLFRFGRKDPEAKQPEPAKQK